MLDPVFKQKISKLDRNKPVYLYCRSGNRKSLDTLKTLGFKFYYNIGEMEQLKTKGFPAQRASILLLTNGYDFFIEL